MKMLYDDSYLGCYYPAFFHMELNTDEEITDLNKVSSETLSTFYHEYIHFLQDITTSYGLMNICHVVDLQKAINDKIINHSSMRFEVPVIIDSDDVAGVNTDLLSLYFGDYKLECEVFHSVDSVKSVNNGLIPNYEKVPSIEVVVAKGKTKFTFTFGAFCILESMAFLIEDLLFDNVTPPPFPYKTATMVCEYLYPEINSSKYNLIYLCDIALNAFNPGQFFCDVILMMRKKRFIPNSSLAIYEFVKEYVFTISECEYTISSLFRHISQSAEKQLSDYFTIPYFESVSSK